MFSYLDGPTLSELVRMLFSKLVRRERQAHAWLGYDVHPLICVLVRIWTYRRAFAWGSAAYLQHGNWMGYFVGQSRLRTVLSLLLYIQATEVDNGMTFIVAV
jgi:hypothetical protein